ncbi:MAG: aminotransferase class I/II-fold pyridoxal phosphate-dependent enzyme [Candidatus Aminicenantaceae bacterium]
MDIFEKSNTDAGYFGPFRIEEDYFFTRPILDPIPGHYTNFQGKKCIQWSINNYLGLAENEEIKQVAVEAAKKFGSSTPMGSRMMTGNTQYHKDLESQLADFLEKESAIVFNYGYLGVIGTISSIVSSEDIIIIDKLSHASMVDATFVSRGKFRIFKHNDMESLENHLKHVNKNRKGGVLVVTEGVFGMRGDLANLKDICYLKDKYNARLFVDDAHGFGVMGERGQGTAYHFGVQDKLDIYLGTFAKAFAAIGGVSASEKRVVEWIRYNARTQVFAKSLPMIYVEVLKKTLEIIRKDRERRQRMWENSQKLKKGLIELGYNIGDVESPITPVYVKASDYENAKKIVITLRKLGIFITAVMYPVVPKGIILFRMIPTASHTEEDINETVQAFKKVRDDLKLEMK